MKRLRIMFFLIVMLLLSGCPKTKILEQQSLTLAIGYDAKENHSFQVTASLLESEEHAGDTNRVVTVEAETSKSARRKLNEKLPNEIATGQTRVVLLNKAIFDQKMLNEVYVLSRDPFFGDMIKIAIVDGSTEDLLTHPYEKFKNIGMSLNSLLEHNSRFNWVPELTLHDFTYFRDTSTLDIAIPTIKREGEEIVITSLSLLHGGDIVGEASSKEGFFLKTLKGKKTPYLYETIIKKKDMKESGMDQYFHTELNDENTDEVKVVFSIIKNKGKVKLVDKESRTFEASLDIDINIEEISQVYKFKENKAILALEKQLGKEVSKDLQSFLDKIRKVNSDVVGFGELYRSHSKDGKVVDEQWGDMFPNIKIHGKAQIDTIRTGIIE
ncbi:Ger(x)C family spore germination protein [Paenibacillus sp. An7]|uniref:Ger(x)C family spore germination protein n=1 Tax=Paenibacillus sp. An7 TaxID=2689577 RepID=UPI0013598CEA|nr:Ger(x)C family spore germination protein [Paenibacillus sp. An7]